MCPIIPVMKSAKAVPVHWKKDQVGQPPGVELTKGYLRFFEPDVFIETKAGLLKAAGLEASGNWRDRHRYRTLAGLIQKEAGRHATLDVGISMHHVYDHLFQKEFQFKKREDPQIYDFIRGDDSADAFFEVAYGAFPRRADLNYIKDYYKATLPVKSVKPSVEIWEEIERKEAGYPLYYTIRGIDITSGYSHDPVIFIFDPLDPGDILDFWNFRLVDHDVMPVNVHWLAESRPLILDFIRAQHRPLPTNRNGVMIRTTIQIGRSLDETVVLGGLALESTNIPHDSVSIQTWYPSFWRANDEIRISSPSPATLSQATTQVQLVPPDDQNHTVRIPELSPDFARLGYASGPRWINAVKTRIFGQNSRFAEAMPSAAVWPRDGYPVRARLIPDQFVSREGHVTLHSFAHDSTYLTLPTMRQAISSWLAHDGIEAVQSDAGRVADQLIASIGSLAATGLIADPESIALFDNMARSRKIWSDGSSEEFSERTAKIGQVRAWLSKLEKKPLGKYKTLDRFVSAGILKLGIAADCSHCTKENWYSLNDIGEDVSCERCLKKFKFPQGMIPNSNNWKYRVVGPFATPHFAQGGYSVALTLRFIDDYMGSTNEFTYSTGLGLRHGGKIDETDFFAWHNSPGHRSNLADPVTLVGECKSLGDDVFKPKDIDRLKSLGTLFPGAYLVVSTLKSELSSGEKSGLRKLCAWGWKRGHRGGIPARVIVLTAHELFSRISITDAWKDAGGRLAELSERTQQVFGFDELAQVTQMGHLGFTEDELFEMRYGRPRSAVRARRASLRQA